MSVDSMGVYRGMDIGTAKPSPADRGPRCPTTCSTWSTRPRNSPSASSRARRAACWSSIDGRGHRALLVGGTGLYLRAVVDDLDAPGPLPGGRRRPRGARPTRPGGQSALSTPGWPRLDPTRPPRIEPDQPPPRRPGPRGDPRLGPAVLLVRSRARRLPADAGRSWSGIRFDPGRPRRPHRASASEPCWTPGSSTRSGAWPRRPGGLSRTARQALGYRELLAHVEDGVPLDEAVAEAVAPDPGLRPPPVGVVPARPAHRLARSRRAISGPTARPLGRRRSGPPVVRGTRPGGRCGD